LLVQHGANQNRWHDDDATYCAIGDFKPGSLYWFLCLVCNLRGDAGRRVTGDTELQVDGGV